MKSDGNKDIKWPASSILIPWDLYQAYGDKSILEKYYPLMSGYLKFWFLVIFGGNSCGNLRRCQTDAHDEHRILPTHSRIGVPLEC
jgi:hypothetical protein